MKIAASIQEAFTQRQLIGLQQQAMQQAAEAIGKPFRVRLDKTHCVVGHIVEAHPNDIRWVGRSTIAVTYTVIMECGENKMRREFTVRRLP